MGLAAWEDELYFTSIATQSPLEIDEGQYSSMQNEGQNVMVDGLITDPVDQ